MDQRQSNWYAVQGRLSVALRETCAAKGVCCKMREEQRLVGGKQYGVPVFEWAIPAGHAGLEYERLVEAIMQFTDGGARANINVVKAPWQSYMKTVLNPPAYTTRPRLPDPTFPEPPAPAKLEAEMPEEKSPRHALLFNTRGVHGEELTTFEERDYLNPLEILRWLNKGYTHVKINCRGHWQPLHLPGHREIERAREARGDDKKARKHYSAKINAAGDEEVEVKPAPEVIETRGVSFDELRRLKEELKSKKKGKGKKR